MPRVPRKRELRRHYLKEWREHRHLTQEQAAERVGLDRTTLGRIENRRIAYTQPILEALSDAYQCEPWDLLNVNPLIDSDVIDAEHQFRLADPDTKRQISEFIAFITRGTGS